MSIFIPPSFTFEKFATRLKNSGVCAFSNRFAAAWTGPAHDRIMLNFSDETIAFFERDHVDVLIPTKAGAWLISNRLINNAPADYMVNIRTLAPTIKHGKRYEAECFGLTVSGITTGVRIFEDGTYTLLGDTRVLTPDPVRRREVMARARHNLEMAMKTRRILGTPQVDHRITHRLYSKVELARAIHEGSHDLIHCHYLRWERSNIEAALNYCRAELYTLSGVYNHLPYNPPAIEEGTVLLKHPKKQPTKELEEV